MLVELYLDMEKAAKVALQRNTSPAEFLLVVPSEPFGREMRTHLEWIHDDMGLVVSLDRLVFTTPNARSLQRLRGTSWYSWAVFCDHTIKGDAPLVWPYNRIRSLTEDPDIEDLWHGIDRDENFVATLTTAGQQDLLKNITMPMYVHPQWGASRTCYPPWRSEDLNIVLRDPFML